MANGLLELHQNWNKFDSVQIRQYCLENFSEKAVIGELTKIYHEHRNINE